MADALSHQEVQTRHTRFKHEGELVELHERLTIWEKVFLCPFLVKDAVDLVLHVNVDPNGYTLSVIHVLSVECVFFLIYCSSELWGLSISNAPNLQQVEWVLPYLSE
jgi:hypothetical protein